MPEPDPQRELDAELEERLREYLSLAEGGQGPELERLLRETPPELSARLHELIGLLSALDPERRPDPGEVGRSVGEYHLRSLLGSGGTGSVWLAEQQSTGRLVALKMMKAAFLPSDRARQRFEREWRAIAKLDHLNIVPLLSAGEQDGTPYFTMARIDGRGLDAVLDALRGKPAAALVGADLRMAVLGPDAPRADQATPNEYSIFRPGYIESVCRLVMRVADALEHAHEAGVVHRDVKPSNILVTRQGVPMLLDFGLALDESLVSLTQPGEFAGTYHYVSPEQAAGSRMGIDRRTDVYSLGVVLYELLTLRRPFEGSSSQEILKQVLLKEPAPLRRFNPAISRDLEVVTLKAIDKDPDRRYARARDLEEDLQNLLALKPVRARPLSYLERGRRVLERNRTASAAAAVVLLALGLLLSYAWWNAREHDRLIGEDLASAAHLLDALQLDQAEEMYRSILRRAPADGAAAAGLVQCRSLRERDASRRRQEAGLLLDAVGKDLDAHRGLRTEAERLRDRLNEALVPRYRTSDESRTLNADRRTLERSRIERQRLAGKMLASVAQAEQLDPANARLGDLRLGLAVERWRDALAERDEWAEAVLRQEIRSLHPEPALEQEVFGKTRVVITGEPPDAVVHLFRFQRQDELDEGGDARLVPAPLLPDDWPEECVPGSVCWVITAVEPGGFAARAGLTPGDLVLRVEASPALTGLYVIAVGASGEAARQGVRPFDQLAAIRDVECGSIYDIDTGTLDARQLRGACLLHFRRGPAFDAGHEHAVGVELRGDLQVDAGVQLGDLGRLLALACPAEPVLLRCVASGEPRDVELPAGSRFGAQLEPTAQPLVFSQATIVGTLPRVETSLERGSYLFVIRAAGHATARIPVLVEQQGEPIERAVRLLPSERVPEGFVLVPGGPFRSGPAGTLKDSAPFCIGRREVTLREYLEFVNDPPVVARRLRSERLIHVPRAFEERYLDQNADGTWRLRPQLAGDCAVVGISYDDAVEYCEWLSARARRDRRPWHYVLPTGAQWEKAARGVDGRQFPWGDAFDWSWTRSVYARGESSVWSEPPGRFLVDASPYDVLDMGGNAAEWSADLVPPGNLRATCGGNWSETTERAFRTFAQSPWSPWIGFISNGLRLCAVLDGE